MSKNDVNAGIGKHRAALGSTGKRLVQISVPAVGHADFAIDCRRQALRANQADAGAAEIGRLLDQAAANVQGWRH